MTGMLGGMLVNGEAHNYVNVLTQARAGCLDEISKTETDRDLSVLHMYVRAEKEASLRLTGSRTAPSIYRSVLTSVWEEPRTGFHRDELDGHQGLNLSYFKSKLLLIPCSVEAFELMKAQDSVANLRLEHVTPLDAIWKTLVDLDATQDTAEDWAREAQAYLWPNYTLAVLTKEQAAAIDGVTDLKVTGYPWQPFLRYKVAADALREKTDQGDSLIPLDPARFVHPGIEN